MNAVARGLSSASSFQHTRHGFMHALSVMAEMITSQFGLKVKFYSGGPKTDGKTTIWLPHLPIGRWVSETVRTLFRGHLFHECAHVLETDTDLPARDPIEDTPLFHACVNSIEDPRIEVLMARRYPYTYADLVDSYAIMAERKECRMGNKGPEDALECFLVYAGFVEFARYEVLRSCYKAVTKKLVDHIGAAKTQVLLDLLVQRYPLLTCTLDVRSLTREVFDLLDIKLPPPKEQGSGGADPQQEGQPGGAAGGGEVPSGDDAQASPPDGEGQPGRKPEAGLAPSSSGSGDQDEAEDEEGHAKGGAKAQPEPGQEEGQQPASGNSPADASPDDKKGNTGDGQSGQGGTDEQKCEFNPNWSDKPPMSIFASFEKLKKEEAAKLPQVHVQTTEEVELREVPVVSNDHTMYQALLEAGMKVVGALAARLMRLLSVTLTPTNSPTFSGRLRTSRAYRFAVGDAKLFRRKQERKAPTFAMSIVGDLSSSMKGRPVRVAAEATVAVAESARRASIPCEVLGFEGERLHVFQAFGEQPMAVRHRIGKMPSLARDGGGTPMGEALYRAAFRLVHRKEQRKLLIVFTDGMPNNRELTEEVIELLKATPGVEVIGIGICCEAVVGLFPTAVVIQNVDELGPALFKLLQDRLLQPFV
jgi:cobaltochelatase CobT